MGRQGTADSHVGQIEPPLILDARGELLFFRTPAHLEAYVEVADVLNGEYGACWDSRGQMLKLEVAQSAAGVLAPLRPPRVQVVPEPGVPPRLWDLHRALLLFIEESGLLEGIPTSNDTADLLEYAIDQTLWS